jgi:fimbrial isopeptide formation D2 family protein/LPXTG-motif cell wall-anchored protein
MAPDMVLGLPAYRFDANIQSYTNEKLTEIHLYPKNEDPPSLDKVVDSDRNDFGIGESIPYKITTLIPAVISSLQQYYLVDIADENLELIPDSLKVSIEDLPDCVKPYEVSFTDESNFRIDFNVDELEDYANKEVTITYQMKLKPGAPADEWLINDSHIYVGAYRVDSSAQIITGGKRFVKTDLLNANRKLADAVFVIRNSSGYYLSLKDDGVWIPVNDQQLEDAAKNNLLTLTSDQLGEFDIQGLAYGKYQLVEVKAPDGYIRLTDPVDFIVAEKTYQDGDRLATGQVVHNIPQTVIDPPTVTDPQPPESGSQKPGLPGFLPQTGEMQSTLLILIGLGIIAIAGYLYKKQNDKKRKGA